MQEATFATTSQPSLEYTRIAKKKKKRGIRRPYAHVLLPNLHLVTTPKPNNRSSWPRCIETFSDSLTRKPASIKFGGHVKKGSSFLTVKKRKFNLESGKFKRKEIILLYFFFLNTPDESPQKPNKNSRKSSFLFFFKKKRG